MSSFPLPTVAVTIDESGITAPSYEDILSSFIASFQQIYGTDVYLQPDGQDYQWLAVLALAQHDTNQATIQAYNDRSPSSAQGAGLSSVVKINGIARKASSNSTVTLTIVGVAGTQIVNGSATDANGNSWVLPTLVTIPVSGGIDVTATAAEIGSISAAANTISIIGTPTVGWQSVNNASDAVVGIDIESDATLRQRQAASTSLPAQTPLQSILAAVANVDGVKRSAIYENSGSVADANGIPAHSIAVVVDGGDDTQIAQIIESKKPPGTGTFGTTSISVQDPSGLVVTINFFDLIDVAVYVTVTIRPMAGYTDDLGNKLQQAIMDFINGIPIGDSVYYNWLFAPASLNGNLAYRVTDITLDVNPNPALRVDLPIAFNQAAVTSLSNISLVIS